MRLLRSPRAVGAAAAASVLLSLIVATPSAVAAQGCSTTPTFCAWDQPFFEGSVHNVTSPTPTPVLNFLLGGPRTCYDLNGPRRSFKNETGYTAVIYDDANCASPNSVTIPDGYMNDNLGINSVLFLPV